VSYFVSRKGAKPAKRQGVQCFGCGNAELTVITAHVSAMAVLLLAPFRDRCGIAFVGIAPASSRLFAAPQIQPDRHLGKWQAVAQGRY
jgi:hypothetical protein